MSVGRVRLPPRRRLKVHVRLRAVARRAVGGLGHACCLFLRLHRCRSTTAAFPSACFCSVYYLVTAAQWLTTSAACCCTAAASRLPILRCMQRYELQSYDEMQAPSQPGKLVHHLASTRQRGLPGTPRRAANAIRQTLPARGRVCNPYLGKNRWATKSTRAFVACRADGQQPFGNAAPADAVAETHLHRRAAPGSPCALLPSPTSVGRGTRIDVGLPRSCPQRRHHCRAHRTPRHRRQDVGV